MYKSVFIDANIFIDSNDDTRSTYEQSYKLIPYLLQNGIKVYTSCDLMTTIYYILAKKDRQKALEAIESINKFCDVISFSNTEIQTTVTLMQKDHNYTDFEDALQYVLAKKQKCPVIISNDKNFYASDLEVLTSEIFCKKYLP